MLLFSTQATNKQWWWNGALSGCLNLLHSSDSSPSLEKKNGGGCWNEDVRRHSAYDATADDIFALFPVFLFRCFPDKVISFHLCRSFVRTALWKSRDRQHSLKKRERDRETTQNKPPVSLGIASLSLRLFIRSLLAGILPLPSDPPWNFCQNVLINQSLFRFILSPSFSAAWWIPSSSRRLRHRFDPLEMSSSFSRRSARLRQI